MVPFPSRAAIYMIELRGSLVYNLKMQRLMMFWDNCLAKDPETALFCGTSAISFLPA